MARSTRFIALAGLLVVTAACSACSSSSASPGASDAGDAGRLRDGGDSGAPAMGCPSALPGAGEACGPQGLVCEYGASNVVVCDPLATCNGGRWELTTPGLDAGVCVSGPASECPASMATVPIGQHCAPFDLDCDYPEGRCACSVRSLMLGPDAAAEATWICPDPASSCPAPRARLGTPCAATGLSCDYGSCAIPGADFQSCLGGVWVENSVSCPQ